jgi:thioredoxin reductase
MERIKKKIKEGRIEIINNTNVTQIKGDKKVTSIILDKPYKGRNEFPIDAVFVEIGLVPLSDLAESIGVAINDKGEITINRDAETNLPGVYAAGDVADTRFKQAITGVAEAVLAVYSAYSYLSEHNIVCTCGDEVG